MATDNNNNVPDPAVVDSWNSTMSKFNSVMGAAISQQKSATQTSIKAQIAEEKLIKSLITELGYTEKQAKLAAKALKQEEEHLKREEALMAAKKESEELEREITRERVAGAKQVANSLGDLVKNTLQAANGLYTTDNAFSAVTPVVTALGSSLSGVIEGMAKMATGWSIAGFSFGGMAEGAAKIASVGISLTTQAMNMQLENAGKMVEHYNELSKVGVTFGGSLEDMRESAKEGGMALDAYTKFVTKNIESLASFGGSTQSAATMIMKLSKATLENNDKLLVMYGGYEAINEAAVGYVDLIARTGFDVTKNISSLNAGAASYLVNMKELSALTGKSADALRQEQEARMKSASYQLALSKMSVEEQTAARNKVSLVTEKYGKEAGDLLEEMIAGQGKVVSESGLTFKSMMGPIAQSIEDIYKTGLGPESTAKTAKTMSEYADVIGEWAKKNQNLMFLNYGTQDQTLQMMNSVLSQTLTTLNSQRNISTAQVELAKEAAKPITNSAQGLADVIKSLNLFKQEIDEKTIKSFKNMAEITKNLIKVVGDLYDLLTPEIMGEAVKKFTSAIREATDALRGITAPRTDGRSNADVAAGANVTPGVSTSGEVDQSGPVTQNGQITPQLTQLLASPLFAGRRVTAKNDGQGVHRRGAHANGTAADIALPTDPKEAAEFLRKVLADPAVKFAQIEDKTETDRLKAIRDAIGPDLARRVVSNPEATGPHLHVQAKLKNGGVTNGPSLAGEAGPEAVVPLPDGRTIPVKMDTAELVSKLEEMLLVMKEQRDNSERMLYAVS